MKQILNPLHAGLGEETEQVRQQRKEELKRELKKTIRICAFFLLGMLSYKLLRLFF